MIRNGILILALALLTGCGALQNQVRKLGDGMTTGDYRITLYSGGNPVREWNITNQYVNSEQNTDGYYFYVNSNLVRVTGDVVIEELR